MAKKNKMNFGFSELSITCVSIGSLFIIAAFAFFRDNPNVFSIFIFTAAMIALGIPLSVRYQKTREIHAIEAKFPEFLRDVTSNIETGMTLPQAIRSVCKNDYGPLSAHIKDISTKLDWGINFEKVLDDFAKKINSPAIKRSTKTIIETHRSGGYIGTVLEAVAESQSILERIKRERSASIYSQMINGYVIFLIFLGVMFGMSTFLVPAFQSQGGSSAELAAIYDEIFRNLILLEGVFAGLAIGKMAEGSVVAGVKHSLVMVSVGFLIFTFL